ELPRIFTKDTLTASRSLLVEKSFVPQSLLPSELLEEGAQWPPLHGFVLTSAREDAELLVSSTKGKEGKTDGPILARWRVGLGKSLAFTSSIKGAWGKDWRNWEGLGQFWARTTEWLCKDRGDPSVSLDLRWDRGEGRITVDMPERQDEFLDLRARIVPPPGSPKIEPVKLIQVGPGRYEGAFSAPRAGVYLVTAGLQEGKRERPLATRGVVMSYPREYKDLKSNPQLLSRLASLTGGKAYSLKETPRGIFERSGESSQSSKDVWPWLLFFASILFVFDIALRRLDFSALSHRIQEAKKAKVDDEQVFEQLMTRKTVLKEKLSVHSQKRDELRRSASSRTMKATGTVSLPELGAKGPGPEVAVEGTVTKSSDRVPKRPESGRAKPRPSSRRQS
ncbi:MAG: glutamine amidotransferase, partial [Planctomycetota bacterium]|nr:glutamine amidotransferase [Planctomycetota bacterium]